MITQYQLEKLRQLNKEQQVLLDAYISDMRVYEPLPGQKGREYMERDASVAPESYYRFKHFLDEIKIGCKLTPSKDKDIPNKVYYILCRGFMPKHDSLNYNFEINGDKKWRPTGFYAYGSTTDINEAIKLFRICINQYFYGHEEFIF